MQFDLRKVQKKRHEFTKFQAEFRESTAKKVTPTGHRQKEPKRAQSKKIDPKIETEPKRVARGDPNRARLHQ